MCLMLWLNVQARHRPGLAGAMLTVGARALAKHCARSADGE